MPINIATASLQEILQAGYDFITQQNAFAFSNSRCQYCTDDNNKCIVGGLLNADQLAYANRKLGSVPGSHAIRQYIWCENSSINEEFEWWLTLVNKDTIKLEFLKSMQNVHDTTAAGNNGFYTKEAKKEFVEKMQALAKDFGLTLIV